MQQFFASMQEVHLHDIFASRICHKIEIFSPKKVGVSEFYAFEFCCLHFENKKTHLRADKVSVTD